MNGLGIKRHQHHYIDYDKISRRIRACDYMSVAQLFLHDNFLLDRPLTKDDIKPRLLGHWGTCHGINVIYANLRAIYHKGEKFSIVIGPGHGFPALQANLFLDGDLAKVDKKALRNPKGLEYICKHFSWPGGFPSHASPMTPNVICEGGELGYALAAAYGKALGHPEKTIAVIIGDGELETATAIDSLNLVKLVGNGKNGTVLPILQLNGYKISGPTIYGRKSERELSELIRGFGFTPVHIRDDRPETFQSTFKSGLRHKHPFFILHTRKGATGPTKLGENRIADNYLAHQIPLPNAKTDDAELKCLENWLKSYKFDELFDLRKGFTL
ncbi:hypothetical protein IKF33_01280 [Candidatus Saccharibacteria bacterium]|nr:hypothetical protein [Candidatus Saccharibacteria bacterium]